MDYIDVVIDTILKGSISYYVKKSLEKIDAGLEGLFKAKDRDQIKRYVADRKLEQPLTDLASETLRGAFLLPVMPDKVQSLEDRAELFEHVLRLGFNLSNKLQADLLLPGSLHSSRTVTLFRRNRKNVPDIVRDGAKVTIQETPNHENQIFFLPAEEDRIFSMFEEYRESMVSHLEDGNKSYFPWDIVKARDGWDNCQLVSITAGACYFRYTPLMKGEVKEYYNPSDGRVKLKDWPVGLESMFSAMAEIPNWSVLDPAEVKDILNAYELFKKLN